MDELDEIRKKKMEDLSKRSQHVDVVIEADDQSFAEKVVEQSKKVSVVVDFWAEWCTPCHMLSPTLESLAQEHKGKFVLAKVDVEQAPQQSQQFAIMSIPSVKMFKDGKVFDEFVGALPEPAVREWLEKNLAK